MLLVDTDAFCKLGIAGLLEEAVAVLGTELTACGRLPALTHMLRRGSLPRTYGAKACEALLTTAERMLAIPAADPKSLDPFVSISDIDPGEAQILATAVGSQALLLSGDKRALRALAALTAQLNALKGRVVTIEAILLELANRIELTELRKRAALLAPFDQTIRICFSSGNADPLSGLRSYFESLESEVSPLGLWKPSRDDS